ncbi:MAG: GNAT family N-acetyltransferase [Lachnospiraceae bacterium]|nr:GNAT family N-acetyltransferase [Lachnospiraceae bacterium]
MTNTNNNKSLHKKHLEAERIVLLPLSEHSMTDDGIDPWYVIIDKENRAPIGMIGMVHQNPEWKSTNLWIVISDEHNRREGYGLEALELVEQYIFPESVKLSQKVMGIGISL